jgi:uncharacterized protein YehS (DUF1456 family)
MNNNDILRRIRYSLTLTDEQMSNAFSHGGLTADAAQVRAWMGKEEEEDAQTCTDSVLGDFLDGLIIANRGPRKPGSPAPIREEILTNNAILKKLRIALTLQEDGMLSTLTAGGQPLSRGELSALFRKPNHKHYRECGDQVLRNFLKGLVETLPAGGPPEGAQS